MKSKSSPYNNHAIKNRRKTYHPSTEHQYNFRSRTATRVAQLISNNVTNFKNLAAQLLLDQHYCKQVLNHIFDVNGKRQSIDKLLRSDDAETKWCSALSNEWGQLSQRNDSGVEFTNIIQFISYDQVPKNRKVTYANYVCDHRPLKEEKWRVRLFIGRDKLRYEFDSDSPTTDLTKTKILLNSVISDVKDGACFLSIDFRDIFLHTPMENP